MIDLIVSVEINGKQNDVGRIRGNDYQDATFVYGEEYMSQSESVPISISLPFQNDMFSPEKTRSFFESLLPEGFSRKAVAGWLKADERDYIKILASLGRECLGAIRILGEGEKTDSSYSKLTLDEVKALASEGATKSAQILMNTHLSLTGASGKVGLYYDEKKGTWYLPKGEAPSTHIVKQSHVRLDHIVQNEQLCMTTAEACGISVPKTFIINLGNGKDDEVLFATERYDRLLGKGSLISRMRSPLRLHQEDFAQALSIPSENKYEKEKSGYLSKMFTLVKDNSSNPIEDVTKLLEIIIFDFLIGNTDCHIKNYSLLYSDDLKSVRLAPAYDIVATQVYNTSPEMPFFIGDEININKLERTSFLDLSDELGLSRKMIEKTFDKVADRFKAALDNAAKDLKEMGYKDALDIKKKILKTGGYRK